MKKHTLHPNPKEHPAMMVKATQSLRSAYPSETLAPTSPTD